jgi:hypothetical protein
MTTRPFKARASLAYATRLTTVLTIGCAGGVDPSTTSSSETEALATVSIGPDHAVHFIEEEPGIVHMEEHWVGADEAQVLTKELSTFLMDQPLAVRYQILVERSGSAASPEAALRLAAADERRSLWQKRMDSGEIAPPERSAPSVPLVLKSESHQVERDWNQTEAFYWSLDCPEDSFDFTWCYELPFGTWDSGWHADTSFYRASAYNIDSMAAGFSKMTIQRWDGTAWVERWNNIFRPSSDDYAIYVTDYPWTKATFGRNGSVENPRGFLAAVAANHK